MRIGQGRLPLYGHRLGDMARSCGVVDKIAYSPQEACHALGIGMTTLYELLGSGRIKSTKVGTRRLIDVQSLRELVIGVSTNQSTSKPRIRAKAGEGGREKRGANAH